MIVFLALPGLAATYTVTTTADSGAGSLREAIASANANPELDSVAFNIPGAGPHTITLSSGQINVSDAVIIDGYTQPGASPNTLAVGNDAVILIEISGTNTGNGLAFSGVSGGTVRGLAINRFSNALVLSGASGITLEGNFIGTDPTGTLQRQNSNGFFILNSSTNNTLGGAAPASRNVISGNITGITLGNIGTINNRIIGNYIGTNAAGTAALSNFVGIGVNSPARM